MLQLRTAFGTADRTGPDSTIAVPRSRPQFESFAAAAILICGAVRCEITQRTKNHRFNSRPCPLRRISPLPHAVPSPPSFQLHPLSLLLSTDVTQASIIRTRMSVRPSLFLPNIHSFSPMVSFVGTSPFSPSLVKKLSFDQVRWREFRARQSES